METGQYAEADRLLRKLLDRCGTGGAARPVAAGRPAGGDSATSRRAQLECLERALDAEYRNLPEVIDLKAVREDYGRLLGHYQDLADALERLKVRPPADFRRRWCGRPTAGGALDPEADGACETAGRILRTLGERELVWDYLTTPVGPAAERVGAVGGAGRQR